MMRRGGETLRQMASTKHGQDIERHWRSLHGKEIRIFARQLGLKACFTQVKGLPRNVFWRQYSKKLKRDLIRVTPVPDAIIVHPLKDEWNRNYNENNPHAGFKIRSSRDLIAVRNRNSLSVGEMVAR